MGSVIENEKTKEKCQIFTPHDIVVKMLDYLGYSKNLFGKKIFESSCGNGQFLKEIVKRYIEDCVNSGLSRTKIKNGLGRDIFAIELDPLKYYECLNSLNEITDSYNLKKVKWQIKQTDALRQPFDQKFDFVVGNPPYVSYWDLDISERQYIENNYTACQYGAWDYSYAFLQDGLNRLNNKGRMVYIVPNSIFKTRSGNKIRSLLLPHLTEIYDFTTTNIFEKVLTSPAIIVVDKNTVSKLVYYYDLSKKISLFVEREKIGNMWIFGSQNREPNPSHRFGDYFRVATSIATQCNRVFVLDNWDIKDDYLTKGKVFIEKKVVRKAASPRGKANRKNEYIIFPYYYLNEELKHYTEEDFINNFPNAYEYLKTKKELLDLRDADAHAQWFEYGRSQALTYVSQKKLLISNIITGCIKVYFLDNYEVPYSGLFITERQRDNTLSLKDAEKILTSEDFFNYIIPYGINASGHSVRIVAKNILDYCW